MVNKNYELPTLKCTRCGHKWIPRKLVLPKKCPFCQNPYWNQVKVKNSGPRKKPDTTPDKWVYCPKCYGGYYQSAKYCPYCQSKTS